MTISERSELIKKYILEYPNYSGWNLAKRILEDNPVIPSTEFEKLRCAVQRAQKRSIGIKEIKIPAKKEKVRWEVIDGNYIWEATNGIINFPVELIDQFFYEYSEHGLNLSQTEIINKHNLQVWQWNSIKSTLWLFKKSNIFSPHTVQTTPPDELEEMIAGKIKAMLDNTGFQVVKQYNKELNKKYRDVIKKQTLQDVTLQAMVLEIADAIPLCKIKPSVRIKEDGQEVINLLIFDIHFGAQNRTNFTPLYSPEIVKETLSKIAEITNKQNAKEVNIFFGGDNVESYIQMHPDSWKGIARGYYGAKLVIELYKALVDFISEINNVKCIYAVPGNHDRATDKKEMDSEGSIAEIVFEMVKLSFQNSLTIKYDEKLISESIDGLHFIMTHGHMKLTDVTPAELILKYGDPYKFNLLVSGHWHERKVKKDHELFRQISCPSLFKGNDYSANLGYTASPGFIIVKNNGYNNKPIVLDYTL